MRGDLSPRARTHWVTTTHFIGFLLLPRFRAYLGASSAWFGVGLSPSRLCQVFCTDGQEVPRQPRPTTPEIRRAGAFRAPIPGLRPYAPSLSPWPNVSPPQPLRRASGSSPSLLHGAQRWTRAPLLTRLRNPSGHAYPKTLQALQ